MHLAGKPADSVLVDALSDVAVPVLNPPSTACATRALIGHVVPRTFDDGSCGDPGALGTQDRRPPPAATFDRDRSYRSDRVLRSGPTPCFLTRSFVRTSSLTALYAGSPKQAVAMCCISPRTSGVAARSIRCLGRGGGSCRSRLRRMAYHLRSRGRSDGSREGRGAVRGGSLRALYPSSHTHVLF